jgi:signal transduction histidine kinase/DNA-binding NarL/FixJ family response regulator
MLIISDLDNNFKGLEVKLQGQTDFGFVRKNWLEFHDQYIHPGLYKIILVNVKEYLLDTNIIEKINSKSKHQPIVLFGIEKAVYKDVDYINLNDFSAEALKLYCIALRKLWESERKKIQVEMQLYKSENRIATIISQTPIIIFIIDLKGIFKMVLGKFWKDFTTDKEMIIGRSIYDVFKKYESFTTLFENTLYQSTSGITIHLNDKYYSVSLSQIFNKELNQDEILGLAYDITENVKAEQILKNAKEIAENASKTKENFITSMSHEIRNPLNSITGFTNLLKEITNNETQLDYLNNIELSGHRLLDLLNKLLDFSKHNADNLSVTKKRLNIKDLINKSVGICKSLAIEKNLYIQVNFHSNTPEWIVSDESKIYQIVLNLLNNAVKYTLKGGIKITVSSVIKNQEPYLSIGILDTGIGIPKNELEFIFESFYRVKNVAENNYLGTGLGLSIVKKLTNDINGEITVQSELEVGSNFELIFPIDTNSEQINNNSLSIHELQEVFNGKRILVADDNLMNQKLIEIIFKSFNAQLFFAVNGNECLNILNHFSDINLILMDIQMPQLDGIETTKIIRSMDEKISFVPIVALTANVSDKDIEQYLNSGMVDYIAKPIDKHSFLQKCASYFMASPKLNDQSNSLTIDFSYLESIAENNFEMLNQILILYFEEYEEWKINTKSSLKNNNYKEALKIIHKFKSSLNLVGAVGAKNALANLEKSIENDNDNINELFNRLIPLINESNQILQQKFKL